MMMTRLPICVFLRTKWVFGLLVASFLVLILMPLLVLVAISWFAWSIALHLALWACWLPRGKDTLVVYSDSPHWQADFEQRILPALSQRAVVLNWSQRRQWKRSLATSAFQHFGGSADFNPLIVVLRPLRRTRVFRLHGAYLDKAHGNPNPLNRRLGELMETLGPTASGLRVIDADRAELKPSF